MQFCLYRQGELWYNVDCQMGGISIWIMIREEGFSMNQSNIFVEGLQGAEKTTFLKYLSERLSGYKIFREGDYSPVELAWYA